MDDNIYKASSQFVLGGEPDEQRDEREKEENAVFAEYPVMSEAITMLEDLAKQYESVLTIPKEIRLDKEKVAIRLDSNTETAANLRAAAAQLTGLVEEYIKNQ